MDITRQASRYSDIGYFYCTCYNARRHELHELLVFDPSHFTSAASSSIVCVGLIWEWSCHAKVSVGAIPVEPGDES